MTQNIEHYRMLSLLDHKPIIFKLESIDEWATMWCGEYSFVEYPMIFVARRLHISNITPEMLRAAENKMRCLRQPSMMNPYQSYAYKLYNITLDLFNNKSPDYFLQLFDTYYNNKL